MKSNHTETLQHLQKWHQGERDGLNALLNRHLSWIRDRVRKRLGNKLRQRVESCDIVQDAVLQFLQYGPRFLVSDDEQFRALLTRIVENVVCDKYDWFTARRRAVALEQPLPLDTILYLSQQSGRIKTPSTSARRNEEEAWIRLGIELLDPEDRELLILRQWENLPFSKIGKHLGVSTKTAWKRHKNALYHLSDKVGELRRGNLSCLTEDNTS